MSTKKASGKLPHYAHKFLGQPCKRLPGGRSCKVVGISRDTSSKTSGDKLKIRDLTTFWISWSVFCKTWSFYRPEPDSPAEQAQEADFPN